MRLWTWQKRQLQRVNCQSTPVRANLFKFIFTSFKVISSDLWCSVWFHQHFYVCKILLQSVSGLTSSDTRIVTLWVCVSPVRHRVCVIMLSWSRLVQWRRCWVGSVHQCEQDDDVCGSVLPWRTVVRRQGRGRDTWSGRRSCTANIEPCQ